MCINVLSDGVEVFTQRCQATCFRFFRRAVHILAALHLPVDSCLPPDIANRSLIPLMRFCSGTAPLLVEPFGLGDHPLISWRMLKILTPPSDSIQATALTAGDSSSAKPWSHTFTTIHPCFTSSMALALRLISVCFAGVLVSGRFPPLSSSSA